MYRCQGTVARDVLPFRRDRTRALCHGPRDGRGRAGCGRSRWLPATSSTGATELTHRRGSQDVSSSVARGAVHHLRGTPPRVSHFLLRRTRAPVLVPQGASGDESPRGRPVRGRVPAGRWGAPIFASARRSSTLGLTSTTQIAEGELERCLRAVTKSLPSVRLFDRGERCRQGTARVWHAGEDSWP
jgi:hypothetical protein